MDHQLLLIKPSAFLVIWKLSALVPPQSNKNGWE